MIEVGHRPGYVVHQPLPQEYMVTPQRQQWLRKGYRFNETFGGGEKHVISRDMGIKKWHIITLFRQSKSWSPSLYHFEEYSGYGYSLLGKQTVPVTCPKQPFALRRQSPHLAKRDALCVEFGHRDPSLQRRCVQSLAVGGGRGWSQPAAQKVVRCTRH